MTRRPIVAFDLGGVVVDVDKSHLSTLGDPDRVNAAFFGARHDALSTGVLSADDYCAAVAFDLGCAVAVVTDAWRAVVGWSAGGRALVDDVRRRADVRCWSNTDPIHAAALALDDASCTSFAVGFMKPDARYFARVLDGVDAADVIYVDDRADNVAAAREFGVDAVVVNGVDEARAAIFARLSQRRG